jgi:hypothetical protein
VSPWLHKELRVFLCPDGVLLLPVRCTLTLSGVRRTIHDRQLVCIEDPAPAHSWRAALLALESALSGVANERTAATVVLSNQFVRFAVVPWQAGLADFQEDLSYARHCLARVYGKPALQWEVRLSHQAPETTRLASGVEVELLDGLRGVFARLGIGLRSIQPHLMATFNDARRGLRQRSAWLALLEPGHLCLALLRDGHWSRVRSQRIEGTWREELPRLLEREAFLGDHEAVPNDVYVGDFEAGDLVLPELDGWSFHALNPVPLGTSEPAAPGHFGMATAG